MYLARSIVVSFLTHCRLNELPHSIYWKSLVSILGMSDYMRKMVELFANSGDPDSVASDLVCTVCQLPF